MELPGQVSIVADEKNTIFNLLTRDICSGGAFFYTRRPLPVGTRVNINLILSLEQLKMMAELKALLRVSGKVIRRENTGMAVSFDKDYHLSPLPPDIAGRGHFNLGRMI